MNFKKEPIKTVLRWSASETFESSFSYLQTKFKKKFLYIAAQKIENLSVSSKKLIIIKNKRKLLLSCNCCSRTSQKENEEIKK